MRSDTCCHCRASLPWWRIFRLCSHASARTWKAFSGIQSASRNKRKMLHMQLQTCFKTFSSAKRFTDSSTWNYIYISIYESSFVPGPLWKWISPLFPPSLCAVRKGVRNLNNSFGPQWRNCCWGLYIRIRRAVLNMNIKLTERRLHNHLKLASNLYKVGAGRGMCKYVTSGSVTSGVLFLICSSGSYMSHQETNAQTSPQE